MRVLVLHNTVGEDPTVAEQDVLAQRDAVLEALRTLGHESAALGCTLDLDAVRHGTLGYRPQVVFNLVESLAGTDRLMPLVPLLLESLQLPFTGASSAAMLATANKLTTKERLHALGLPTPAWLSGAQADNSAEGVAEPGQWIIKPVWEHASLGMDDECVVWAEDWADLSGQLQRRQRRLGRPMLAERFVEGREFNLSLLAGEVLPPAEIDFSAFPPGKPRIVGEAAKWDAASFEYQQTPRRFALPAADATLLESLRDLARQCWDLFHLSGFARVDCRVDADGRPWVLEVNVNPCLAPDAGFAAALAEGGLTFPAAVSRILRDALPQVDPIALGRAPGH